MEKVYKTLTVKQGDDGWWTASTPSIDREGDIVEPFGLDLSNWQAAGAPLIWGHSYREFWSTIGRAPESRVTDTGFDIKPEWRDPVNDSDPMTIIRGIIDQGLIRQLSIGFLPKEWEEIETGLRYTKAEILEISAVNVAANQDALRLTVRSLGLTDETEERLAEIEAQLKTLERVEPDNPDTTGGTGDNKPGEPPKADVETRTEPTSGQATRSDNPSPDTDDSAETRTEPTDDGDAEFYEAIGAFLDTLEGELT